VWLDPVHDFAFLRYDTKAIKHLPITSLKLRPDLAKVGVAIRVLGNDAGQKISIHSGHISRVDRNAPIYSGYTDFNTNYLQASASAVGGSSGSPVINMNGDVIGIQSGGHRNTSTDFFLPVDCPLRALRLLQSGDPISRGTIQTQWWLESFAKCSELGLSTHWEAEIRKAIPDAEGLLVSLVVME
jgi:pro-apoptotic serine protease NMA111